MYLQICKKKKTLETFSKSEKTSSTCKKIKCPAMEQTSMVNSKSLPPSLLLLQSPQSTTTILFQPLTAVSLKAMPYCSHYSCSANSKSCATQ